MPVQHGTNAYKKRTKGPEQIVTADWRSTTELTTREIEADDPTTRFSGCPERACLPLCSTREGNARRVPHPCSHSPGPLAKKPSGSSLLPSYRPASIGPATLWLCPTLPRFTRMTNVACVILAPASTGFQQRSLHAACVGVNRRRYRRSLLGVGLELRHRTHTRVPRLNDGVSGGLRRHRNSPEGWAYANKGCKGDFPHCFGAEDSGSRGLHPMSCRFRSGTSSCNQTVMERAKNKRARLKAVRMELAALNAELETFLTDEQVAEDHDSVMNYEDAATSFLALLEHHMNRLKVSSPASTAHPLATTTAEDPPATSEREPTRLSTGANSPESSEKEMERLLEFLLIEVECRERSAQITAPQLMETRTHDNQSSRKIAPPPSAAVLYNKTNIHFTACVFCLATVPSTEECASHLSIAEIRSLLSAQEGKPLVDAVVFPSVSCEHGVSLLIGSDQLWKVTPNNSEVRWDSDNRALIAIKTSMGWTLQGPSSVEVQGGKYTSSHICGLRTDVHEKEDLSYPLQSFW
ncbi:hypothetical protein HPB52_020595 [Rhipicephalus sanguineus]|uniref:Uncharacterized protein n=1 Tax=Rhipicephalus sanguineus TaxID=34632 RepID=A0A9D4PYM3_RHISA|nr:hypothetical protein HPB52_020595 [Rhipicephalus sanguineus]